MSIFRRERPRKMDQATATALSDARKERLLSQRRLETAREEVIEPLERMRRANHVTQRIRDIIIAQYMREGDNNGS